MTQTGKISVLMGIYNCEDTLGDAIDSVLAQTYENWELILCDDCSTDSTYSIAARYQAAHPDKIVLLKNETNSRLAYTLNRCLEAADGEFVARMDGDDRSLPTRFEEQVLFLREHGDVVLVGTAMQRFSDDGTPGGIVACPPRPDRFTPHRSAVFNHATVLSYKWVYDALGGYTVLPRTVRGQDLDLWYRFLHAGYQGANIPKVLYMVREDAQAFKRRTVRARLAVFRTTLYGYRLLGYPWHWYLRPILALGKALVPVWVIRRYRSWQTKKQDQA